MVILKKGPFKRVTKNQRTNKIKSTKEIMTQHDITQIENANDGY